MTKYPEIQIIASRFIFSLYGYNIRSFTVILYNYYYRFAVVEVRLQDVTVYVLGQIVTCPDFSEPSVFHELRTYATKQRAEIAFTALTEL